MYPIGYTDGSTGRPAGASRRVLDKLPARLLRYRADLEHVPDPTFRTVPSFRARSPARPRRREPPEANDDTSKPCRARAAGRPGRAARAPGPSRVRPGAHPDRRLALADRHLRGPGPEPPAGVPALRQAGE